MTENTTGVQRPRSSEPWGRGITLAVLVHVVLLIAIAFGVSWRSSEPAGIEAELWAAVPQVAAPRAEAPPEPKQEPRPEQKPQPKPEPKPQARPEPKPEPKPEPVRASREAEIAIEKARQQKLREHEQREQEQREREKQREREAAQKRIAQDEQKRKLAEEEKRRVAEEQKKKQAAAEAQAKRDAERKEAEAEARREAERKKNLARIIAQAGGTGAPSSTGTAAVSSGPSAGYAGRIKARVKPNIVFNDDIAGNPPAEVEVRAAPDGTILGRRLVRSSGSKAWDDAVLRAIDRTAVLPRDVDGTVPSEIEIIFRPKD